MTAALAGLLLFGLTGCSLFEDPEVNFPELSSFAEPVTTDTQVEYSETASEVADGVIEDASIGETVQEEYIYVTVSGAGDVTMGKASVIAYENSFDEMYDQKGAEWFFSGVKDVFAADDLTIVNLEGPLTNAATPREGRDFNMKGKPEYVQILSLGNIEAVTFANNHNLDYLQTGFDDTVDNLIDQCIRVAYDRVTFVYDTQGIRIGVMGIKAFADSPEVEKQIQRDISDLQAAGADVIIACIHGGEEGKNQPEDFQKILYRKVIDWGADLVLGTHAHVLQGIEVYKGNYIVYGLGNFCFGGNRNPSDKDTMIFQQTFIFKKSVEGTIARESTLSARVLPCSISSVKDRNDYQPTLAQGEEYSRILDKINTLCSEWGVQFDSEGYYISP